MSGVIETCSCAPKTIAIRKLFAKKTTSAIAKKIIDDVSKTKKKEKTIKKGGICKTCKKEYKNLEKHYETEFHKKRLQPKKVKKVFKSTNKYQSGECPICHVFVSNISNHKKNLHSKRTRATPVEVISEQKIEEKKDEKTNTIDEIIKNKNVDQLVNLIKTTLLERNEGWKEGII